MSGWKWLGQAPATAARRAALRALLGPLPSFDVNDADAPHSELVEVQTLPHARLEVWKLALNAEESVPAWLLLPLHHPPRGLVLYNHAHGNRFDTGKSELLNGRPALQSPPYGVALPEVGWAVLAIDHWCFGERATSSERATVKRLLWEGRTLWGYRVHDTLAAFNWLRTQPRFAQLPTATLGLSMGSTMAVWAAALEPHIGVCIDLCCLAEHDALLARGSHDLHGEYFFVPGLRREFSAAEIAALIAPRRHLSLVGRHDPLTPPAGVQSVDDALRRAYAALDHPDEWEQVVVDAGHQETPAMRERVLQTLRQLERQH
jgi:dienelactone hydrolase